MTSTENFTVINDCGYQHFKMEIFGFSTTFHFHFKLFACRNSTNFCYEKFYPRKEREK